MKTRRAAHEVTLYDPETGHFVSFLKNVWGDYTTAQGHINGCTYTVEKHGKYGDTTARDGNLLYVTLREAGYQIWKPSGVYFEFPRVLF